MTINAPAEIFVGRGLTREDVEVLCEQIATKYQVKYKIVFDDLFNKMRVLRSASYPSITGMRTLYISFAGRLE